MRLLCPLLLAPLILGFTLASTPAAARPALVDQVESQIAAAGPGLRIGLFVIDERGEPIIAIRPDERFIPASNTKIVTTVAAYALLDGLDQPDTSGGAAIHLNERDVILEGRGDARLSSAEHCIANCLTALADAVAAKTRRVHDITGDDTLFPDERWSPGMSWNNIQTRSGTAASALSIDDNELVLMVRPATPGQAPAIDQAYPYFRIESRAVTAPKCAPNTLMIERAPNSDLVRISGTIPEGDAYATRLGIDDPAHFAAWRLKTLLEARGVRVTGTVRAEHRPLTPADNPETRAGAAPARTPHGTPLATLTPPPLADDIVHINKVSQNMHTELLLRRIATQYGSGSLADGQAAVKTVLERAGLPQTAYAFSDGSGMSTYNRISPRGMVTLLRWVDAQPWAAAWHASLPVAGVDGTLQNRFKGTALEGRLFAKTGTINATNALAGYFLTAKGRRFTFAAYANDVPEGVRATNTIDGVLTTIAAAY